MLVRVYHVNVRVRARMHKPTPVIAAQFLIQIEREIVTQRLTKRALHDFSLCVWCVGAGGIAQALQVRAPRHHATTPTRTASPPT